MTKRKKIRLTLDVVFLALLVAIDQISKYYATLYLKGREAFSVIDGVLELKYLENQGAAFGMLQNQKYFFIFVAVVILLAIGYVLFCLPAQKKYRLMQALLVLIAAGAIGNMIDRLRQNYVVDFIYAVIIRFPIFNFADICVTVSTFLLIFAFLFYYREEDLNFLTVQAKKTREVE
mgnify:CR=1 FL=1